METTAPTTQQPTADRALRSLFEAQRRHRQAAKDSTARQRIRKLKLLRGVITGIRKEIQDALHADFRKPASETDLTEIFPTLKAIDFAVKHLEEWVKPKKVDTPLALMGSDSFVHYEPRGTVLIIAPWNYPFYLLMDPLVSAIAAGNTAVLKPSELAPNTSRLVRRLVGEIFPDNEVAVAEGGKEVSETLVSLPFDHIFFTGSTRVGKLVMKAAAENLASVTLELGGKSPTVVDETADLSDAAEKIVFGKFVNAGQTCVAPDYLLVHESVRNPLLSELKKVIQKFYGSQEEQPSTDYARIISDQHYQRLTALLDDARERGAMVEAGGSSNPVERFIAPTLLTRVSEEMKLMQEEIFGPLLPIVPFSDLSEAVSYINQFDKPLAAYFFTKRKFNADYLLERTSAGGTCVNDTIVHLANPSLPFGGVNHSGIGKAHGYYGFLAFSNERSVLRQRVGLTSTKLLYPPYNFAVRTTIDKLLKFF